MICHHSRRAGKTHLQKTLLRGVITKKVFGWKWKQPKQNHASTLKVSHKRSTFEERARQKEIKKAFKGRVEELKEKIRVNKVEKRKLREEREKKEENVLKSGMKLQKITNPKTLKKLLNSMQKKQLMVILEDALKR